MTTTYTEMTKCLVCDSQNITPFCDLGDQPLANNLKDSVSDPDELFPLSVNVCKRCWHSQLGVAVDREALYKHYLYVSGTSNTLVDEFDKVADIITAENPNGKTVLDIACNDGTFLKALKSKGWTVAGIDPAQNIVDAADPSLNIVCDFFPSSKVTGKFDVITCFNVVAHIPNPKEFVAAAAQLLNDDGTMYIQTSQKDMILRGEFDTIYHEHHSFFTIHSMFYLLQQLDLRIEDVEFRPVHGNSYLFKIKKSANITNLLNDAVLEKFNLEKALYQSRTYNNFGSIIAKDKEKLLDIISKSNRKVVGYGAAAKGVVVTNHFGIHHEYIVDENPLKIGKVIGGVNIPVVSPDHLAAEPEDLTIIVYAWNFCDEIANKIRNLRPNNNDLIIPSRS